MGMKATVGRVPDGTAEKGDAGTSGSGSGTSGIRGDETNILILLFLYILQGIPLGLAGAIPLILTNRNVRLVPVQYGTVCLPGKAVSHL
jgi:PAT family acetyl-CoA transporter-like MFS transporter 1